MRPLPSPKHLIRTSLRILLSYYVCNGVSAALGLLLISGGIHFFVGPFAAAAASVGVIVCIPADQPSPQRGKLWQLLPAALLGLPLFFAVQLLYSTPFYLGLLLVPASFLAFLAAAWGKRGLPISVSIMFAMIFSMATPHTDYSALVASVYFALGAGLYLIYACIANSLLNERYRVQFLADALLSLASLMRIQARQFTCREEREALLGKVLQHQASLTDQLQGARDLILEAPRNLRRQQLAAMLLGLLEMRDHLIACELDLEILQSQENGEALLQGLRAQLETLSDDLAALADQLLCRATINPIVDQRDQLLALLGDHSPAIARSLVGRLALVGDEAVALAALARGEQAPDATLVRDAWQLFVSPMKWSWQPIASLQGWDAPPLRHALRAALAIGFAYGLSLALPWGTHEYWILLTIVVVFRGSLAQTLERRNSRVLGTLGGCVIAAALLSLHLPLLALLMILTLAQALAHGFAAKRYLVTAVSATVLGLLQAHMLAAGGHPVFDMLERIADTLIGVGIAWAFSYVLPSWEKSQIPALVKRVLKAQAQHARCALALSRGGSPLGKDSPQVHWRLARREAFNSLSALVQACSRALAEPRAVQPPVRQLEHILAHSYQLLAQLTLVKTLLLLRRDRLHLAELTSELETTATALETLLLRHTEPSPPVSEAALEAEILAGLKLPDPFAQDLSIWLRRRLRLALHLARQLRREAEPLAAKTTPKGQ